MLPRALNAPAEGAVTPAMASVETRARANERGITGTRLSAAGGSRSELGVRVLARRPWKLRMRGFCTTPSRISIERAIVSSPSQSSGRP